MQSVLCKSQRVSQHVLVSILHEKTKISMGKLSLELSLLKHFRSSLEKGIFVVGTHFIVFIVLIAISKQFCLLFPSFLFRFFVTFCLRLLGLSLLTFFGSLYLFIFQDVTCLYNIT